MRSLAVVLSAPLLILSLGCAGEPGSEASAILQVDTLPNGALHRRYLERPDVPLWTLEEEVRLGIGTGDEDLFGDVRGIEVSPDGQILVLDYQASELRKYAWDGEYLETLAREGGGPREIGEANGMKYGPSGTLWINDYGNDFRILGLTQEGESLTFRKPDPSWGFVWHGGVTEDGRVWDRTSRRLGNDGPPYPPGFHRNRYVLLFVGTNVDQVNGQRKVDSIRVGEYESVLLAFPRGAMGVPHHPTPVTALDPAGHVWVGVDSEYRLLKRSLEGDTILEVSLPAEPEALSGPGQDSIRSRIEDFMARAGRIDLPWDDVIPGHYPVLETLTVDDAGRLWVARPVPGGAVVYDVLGPEGRLLAQAELHLPPDLQPILSIPPRVRGDRFLAVVTDELDLQYVVGARINPG